MKSKVIINLMVTATIVVNGILFCNCSGKGYKLGSGSNDSYEFVEDLTDGIYYIVPADNPRLCPHNKGIICFGLFNLNN